MYISKGSKWYSAFMFSINLCGVFIPEYPTHRYRNGTNLCHLVRVIFLYTPLIFLSQILTWLAVITVVIILPNYLYGVVSYGKFMLGAILGGVMVWGLCLFVSYQHRKKKHHTTPQPGVIKSWVKAKKQRICPLIGWEEEDDD